jgi:hypothetical protein
MNAIAPASFEAPSRLRPVITIHARELVAAKGADDFTKDDSDELEDAQKRLVRRSVGG